MTPSDTQLTAVGPGVGTRCVRLCFLPGPSSVSQCIRRGCAFHSDDDSKVAQHQGSGEVVVIHLRNLKIFFFFLIIYLAVLGLHCCEGFSLVVVNGGSSLVAVASLVETHGL